MEKFISLSTHTFKNGESTPIEVFRDDEKNLVTVYFPILNAENGVISHRVDENNNPIEYYWNNSIFSGKHFLFEDIAEILYKTKTLCTYRITKINTQITVIKCTRDTLPQIATWSKGRILSGENCLLMVEIPNKNGNTIVTEGDTVIKNARGEFFVVKEEFLDTLYELGMVTSDALYNFDTLANLYTNDTGD